MTRRLLPLLIVMIGFFTARTAAAEDPNVVFKGRILVSDKRFPSTAKSPAAYVAAMRKQAGSTFKEDKEKEGWKLYFVGFLSTKLNDLEYLVKVYDVTSASSKKLVQSFEQYTTDRGQATIQTNFLLDKKTTGVNRTLLVTMEAKNKVLASGTFKITGEGEKYTGKVDFSKDDDDEGKKPEEKPAPKK